MFKGVVNKVPATLITTEPTSSNRHLSNRYEYSYSTTVHVTVRSRTVQDQEIDGSHMTSRSGMLPNYSMSSSDVILFCSVMV